jgi:hypothetical protein
MEVGALLVAQVLERLLKVEAHGVVFRNANGAEDACALQAFLGKLWTVPVSGS